MKIINTILIMLIMFTVAIFIIAIGTFALVWLRDNIGYNKFAFTAAIIFILWLIYQLGKSIYNSL